STCLNRASPLIQLQKLTKHFGDKIAVDDLSINVSPGEVYGLLGPNGAGKTTTLRMILGLMKPTSGTAVIDGCSAADKPMEIRQRIGLVSASSGLYQWLSPREILQYFAVGYGLDKATADERIQKLTDVMQLHEFVDQRCATLSTGQKQRVTLARALIHDPPVVLLDEPTRGLDIVATKVVFEYIQHLRDQQKAIIVCTHRLDDAERVCDRFGLLYHGHLQYEGNLPELRQQTGQPALVEIFLELLQGTAVA
ncbi:UNVERIFIED_CONTAM: hypothetical protein GTU68_050455, partial [Idotea baltica]|nr:hypothetical protein [Idotea baltica]